MAQYVQITDITASTALTVPGGMKRAVVEVEGASAIARYRTDGTAPTTSVGHILKEGDVLNYRGDLTAIRFIKSSGTPVLNVTFNYD